jgi:hypothetical protein
MLNPSVAEAYFYFFRSPRCSKQMEFAMATKKSDQRPKKKPGQRPGSMHIDKRVDQVLDDPVGEGSDTVMLTTRAVAMWLGVSEAWLEIHRLKHDGPPYHQYSNRMVAYRRGDVRKWLDSRRRFTTKR